MGQKVHPHGMRLGVTTTWLSRWYTKGNYAKQLQQDFKLREFINKRLASAGISSVEIERTVSRVKVNVRTARPGLVIGKKGRDIEEFRQELKKMIGREVIVNIIEVRKADLDANLVAQNIANQLVRRVAYRRAMKDAIAKAMKMGAEGVKIMIGGRLAGADIARTEWAREGRVPLHTLRAKIDYGTAEALTTYGILGIKVWIFRGEVADGIDAAEQIAI
ncbi:MAG: 30S ribosomal protein S3 [Deltaproteobacteria bacterium]|jgi:small subunit ribosomal protein S3|nr:30S ribosomal protein S3 [Deltaproteobacteria bacterium]